MARSHLRLTKRTIYSAAMKCDKKHMSTSELITVDPDILGGTPVFKGTRVPVKSLFDYLERDYSLEEFLECFPSVTREMACQVLDRSEAALLAPAQT
jgi:uncharacterized protein (DUF433 family)